MLSRAEHIATGHIVVFSDDKGTQQLAQSVIESLFERATSLFCSDRAECIAQVTAAKPDVCIVDTQLDSNFAQFLTILRSRSPRTELFVIAAEDTNDALFNSLRCGASVYLPRATLDHTMLGRALLNHQTHGAFLPLEVSKRLLLAFRGESNARNAACGLTSRERELLDLLSRGMRPKSVAQSLNLSYETVRTHIKNIYKKLGVSSISHATTKVRLRRRDDSGQPTAPKH